MGNEYMSLDDRLKCVSYDTSNSQRELLDIVGKIKIEDIYNKASTETKSFIEIILEDSELDGTYISKVCIGDFILMIAHSICMWKEEAFQRNKLKDLPECEAKNSKYLALYEFILMMYKYDNNYYKRMLQIKVKDLYEIACKNIEEAKINNFLIDYIKPSKKAMEYNLIEYIKVLYNRTKEPWCPSDSLEEYSNKMLGTYEEIYINLFYIILHLYKDKRTFVQVRDIYKL